MFPISIKKSTVLWVIAVAIFTLLWVAAFNQLSRMATEVKSARMVIAASSLSAAVNAKISRSEQLAISGLRIGVNQEGQALVIAKVTGVNEGVAFLGDLALTGDLEYGAIVKHFKFYPGLSSVELQHVATTGKAVSYSGPSKHKQDLGDKIGALVGEAFSEVTLKDVEHPATGAWARLNSVKMEGENVVLTYSFIESTKWFVICVGLCILALLVLWAVITHPEMLLFMIAIE